MDTIFILKDACALGGDRLLMRGKRKVVLIRPRKIHSIDDVFRGASHGFQWKHRLHLGFGYRQPKQVSHNVALPALGMLGPRGME